MAYFKLEGKEELIAQLKGIPDNIDTGVSETLKTIGNEVRDNIRAKIQDGYGFPSEPGSSPHSQSGKLRKDIFSKLNPRLLGQEILLTVGVGWESFYAFILEYGAAKYTKGFKRTSHKLGYGAAMSAKNGQRLLPRPFFWESIEKFWATAPGKVEGAVDKVLKKYAH